MPGRAEEGSTCEVFLFLPDKADGCVFSDKAVIQERLACACRCVNTGRSDGENLRGYILHYKTKK